MAASKGTEAPSEAASARSGAGAATASDSGATSATSATPQQTCLNLAAIVPFLESAGPER
jgi:hypothetical protein